MELIFVLLHICLFLFVFRIAISIIQQGKKQVKVGANTSRIKTAFSLLFLLSFFGLYITELVLRSLQVNVYVFPAFLSRPIPPPLLLSGLGIFLCILSVIVLFLTLSAMGESMRFGLYENNKGKLIMHGIFSRSRNPFFVSILLLFFGIAFLIPSVFFIVCAICSLVAIHFYILKEERFLRQHYGGNYLNYSLRVRRYF